MTKLNTFQIVSKACAESGVMVVLIGGYALGAYGHQRLTMDVDVMISDRDVDRIRPELSKLGYDEVLRSHVVVRFATKLKSDTMIDLMLVDSKTFDRVKTEGKTEIYGGCKFIVPKLEHLIALKLHALKEQFEKRETKDLPDIAELIKRNKINVNSDEFRDLCLKYGTADVYKKILSFAAFKK